ncbi:Integrator complex subunit 2 [Chytriomyces hyalinus]|nr:Integrator complex subunit 2 [Chytriomyces hyalinus]
MLQDLVTNQTKHYTFKLSLITDILHLLPFLFDEIVTAILDNPGPDSALLLKNLATRFPQHALMLRNLLIQKGIYLHVALETALGDSNRMVFLNAILSRDSSIFSKDAGNADLIETLNEYKRHLFYLVTNSKPTVSTQCVYMRLICAFVGYFRLVLTNQECESVLAFVAAGGSTERISKLKLCALITCGDQLMVYSQQKYIECLKQIVDSDLSEVTLMIGVFCHTNQLMDIVHLVRSVTDVQVALTPDGLSKLRLIFINNLLKEDEIARRSLIMRPLDLNARDGQSLENSSGMTVVYELLKAGIFVRSGIDIRTWVFESIKSYQPPYHPKYPDLIKRYIEALLDSPTFTQISEREVSNCFIRGDAITPMRVVLLFQVLHFNERYFAKKTAPAGPDFVAVNPNCTEYTPTLMDQLPINQVLGFIERPENREAFQPFYSSLMSLVVSQFPQIVTATAFLNAESLADEENIIPFEYQLGILYESMKKSGFHGALPPFLNFEICDSVLVAVFRRCAEDAATAVACLETLCAMDSSKLLNHLSCIVSTLFPLVLKDRPVTSIELIKKPLELFQCDSRVFQIPTVFSVFLHMLDCYLIASRQHYFHTFQIDVSQDKTQKLKETHLYALLELQETAAMQALLELCVPRADSASNGGKINRAACQFVHQRFVVSKKSMKLVHFQGYRDELIDVTVEGIASMHVCFEFIAELLSQPQLEKQVFGIQLACKLCVKYPIPNSHNLALTILVPKMMALSNQIEDTVAVGIPVMPQQAVQHASLEERIAKNQSLLKVIDSFRYLLEAFPSIVENVEPFVIWTAARCIQMKYIGAYLLATLGGNETPSAKDIKKILSSVGIEAEASRIENLLSELEGKNIADIIAEGTKKMASLPAGGAAAPAAAGSAAPAAGGAAAAAPKKEEKEEKEESDDDMGFGLFD